MSAEPVQSTPPLQFEPMSPPDWYDPYPTYRRLRDEAPVYLSPDSGIYTVSRFDDVVSVLRRPEIFSSSSAFDVLFEEMTSDIGWRDLLAFARFIFRSRMSPRMLRDGPKESMIMLDPPRHDALRNIVNRGFTPRRIDAWQGRIGEIVEECMTKLTRSESFDVVRDLAIPVPMQVIAEIIGIDPGHREKFKLWSNQIVAGVSSADRRKSRPAFMRAITDLTGYVQTIVEERRARPKDDLIHQQQSGSHAR